MPEQRPIPIADLQVDPRNPRLEEGLTSQVDAIRSMLRHLGRKIVVLAEDIVEHGINPTELMIAMADEQDETRFTVLEGNRRLTALKVLETPDLADGAIAKRASEKLQDLSGRYLQNPVSVVQAWVVESREEAAHWMMLRHETGHEGAGVEQWGGIEKQRFASWRGGAPTAALQIMQVVLDHGGLDDETRKKVREVPTSTYMRVVQTPAAAAVLGVQYDRQSKKLKTFYPEAEVAKGLSRLLVDLATEPEEYNSRTLNSAGQIKNYVQSFRGSQLPAKKTKLKTIRELELAPGGLGAEAEGEKKKKGKRAKPPRNNMIPSTAHLHIHNARLEQVERELRQLQLDRYANAVSVLFRVFVELSMDHHLTVEQLKTEPEIANMRLRDKLRVVGVHLVKRKLLSAEQGEAVKKAAQDQLLLATGVTTFHKYVHNQYVIPKPLDLRSAWDELQPCLEAVWRK